MLSNMETDAGRPGPREAAEALRQAEEARSSIRNLPARPWYHPALAVLAAAMAVGALLLGTIGFGIFLVAITVMTMVGDRHDEAVGVRDRSMLARPAEMVAMAPGIVAFVVAGACYTQYDQAWGLPVAAVALAVSVLAAGAVRRRGGR